ncbi:MAG: hypothetical protein ACPGU0_07100, partial [Marinirhabdus sp.]
MKKKATKTENLGGRTKQPRSRIAEMSAKNVVETAHNVVKKAADILEEEIAAGIIAAKQIEKKFINVEQVRDKDPDHIMSRFRTDAYEVIDMLMDIASVASTQLEQISKKVVNISALTNEGKNTPAAHVPVIRNEKQYKAGGEAILAMQLQNDHKEKAMEIALRETDLVDPTGQRILMRNIKMNPEVLILKPGEKKDVKIHVKIPKA